MDEVFNVQQGVFLAEAVRTHGVWLMDPQNLREVFSPPLHLPDHPPLGRFWLGVHHQVMWWLAPPTDPDGPFVVACARPGSATAFALTVLLVGVYTGLGMAPGAERWPRCSGPHCRGRLATVISRRWNRAWGWRSRPPC